MVTNKVDYTGFVEAAEAEIDEVARKLQTRLEGSILVSKENIPSFFEENNTNLSSVKLVVPGYLVKAGVPTCNTKVSKLVCYLVAQSRPRGIKLFFVAPTRRYLDSRIVRYLSMEEVNGA